MSAWCRIRTNAPQHLAQLIRMCSLFVSDAVLLTWGLVRIVLRSANVARDFSFGHLVFTCTTKQRGLFEARPLLVSKFKDRKLSHLHVSDEIEEVGNN
jgi:hypothetical protein